jgi:DNA-binding CsgD family transcriptional regulator
VRGSKERFDVQEKIEYIKLSPRTQCVLEKLDVRTVDQLLHLSESHLARIRLVGDEVRRELCSIVTLYLNVKAINAAEQSVKTAFALSEQVLAQYQSLIAGLRKLFWKGIGSAVAEGSRNAFAGGAPADMPAVGGTPLELLQLSVRPYNCLMRAGVTTIEQLLSLSRDEILTIRQLGSKSMSEIEACVMSFPTDVVRDRSGLALMFAVSPLRTSGEVELPPREVTAVQAPICDSGLLTADDRVWLIRVALSALQDSDIVSDDGPSNLDYLVSRFIAVVLSDGLLPEAFRWLKFNYPKSFLISESPALSLLSLWPSAILDLSCSAVELPLDDIPTARLGLPPDVAALLKATQVQSLASLLINWDRMSGEGRLLQKSFATFISWLVDQPRQVWLEQAHDVGTSPVYKLVLQDVSAEDLLKRWITPLRSERDRQMVLLRYGVKGSQLTLQECAQRYGLSRERIRQIVNKAERALPRPSLYPEIAVAVGLGEALIREAGGIISEATLAQRMELFITFGRVPAVRIFRFLFLHQSERIVRERCLKAWRLAAFPTEVAKQLNELIPTVEQGDALPLTNLLQLIRKTDLYSQHKEILTPEYVELCARFYGVPITQERRASSVTRKLQPTSPVVQNRQPAPSGPHEPRTTKAVSPRREPTPPVASRSCDSATPFDEHLISALRAIRRAAHYDEIAELVPCGGKQAQIRLNSRSDIFRNYGLGFYGLEEWESGW